MRSSIVFALLLAGCGSNNSTDAAVDRPALMDLPGTNLCTTTAACAQKPCTPGCVFQIVESGPCPNGGGRVFGSDVKACTGFCGFLTLSNAAGCGVYNGAKDGCEACGSRWGDASCVDQNPAVDYVHGGAICPSGTYCFDGRPPGDANFCGVDLGAHD